jgi:type II secretory pathway pseudopilin PulG
VKRNEKKEKILGQQGISLNEVLASFVIISILFLITNAYFINSNNESASLSKKYSAVQIADSLLDIYKSMNYSDLYNKIGTTDQIDIKSMLQLDPATDISSYSATAVISKFPIVL